MFLLIHITVVSLLLLTINYEHNQQQPKKTTYSINNSSSYATHTIVISNMDVSSRCYYVVCQILLVQSWGAVAASADYTERWWLIVAVAAVRQS